MRFLVCLIAVTFSLTSFADLKGYVEREDDSYTFAIEKTEKLGDCTVETLKFTSQTWQEITWNHYLVVITPPKVDHDTALVHITGGDTTDGAPSLSMQEITVLKMVAEKSSSVTAILFQVPNQPLFNGLNEDGIIAYTYDKYLTGQGEDWPLLFAMVKSAVRAMDTISAVTKQKEQDVKQFVLTGGSKRGWTSWLSAAVDDRVRAIAPVVIDVLNMEPQMQHMYATYGGYSNQIEEYTRLKIQERMNTPEGRQLGKLVDPWYYRDNLDMPKLIVNGANDPYWTVDAANYYYDDLPGDKRLYYQANTGHDIGLGGISTVSQWYLDLLQGDSFPQLTWKQPDLGTLDVTWDEDGGEAFLWKAESTNRDFRDQTWTKSPLVVEGNTATAKVEEPAQGWIAYYVEVSFPGEYGMPYGITSKMTVLPDKYPTSGRAYDAPAAASEQESH